MCLLSFLDGVRFTHQSFEMHYYEVSLPTTKAKHLLGCALSNNYQHEKTTSHRYNHCITAMEDNWRTAAMWTNSKPASGL